MLKLLNLFIFVLAKRCKQSRNACRNVTECVCPWCIKSIKCENSKSYYKRIQTSGDLKRKCKLKNDHMSAKMVYVIHLKNEFKAQNQANFKTHTNYYWLMSPTLLHVRIGEPSVKQWIGAKPFMFAYVLLKQYRNNGNCMSDKR